MMMTDTAVLLLLADLQRIIEELRAENASLRQQVEGRAPLDERVG